MTIGKTIALTRWMFVRKVMSLLFNMLSRFVIVFLPRSKRLLFMASGTICSDFGAQEKNVYHSFHCFPIYLPWSDETGYHDLSVLNVEFEASFFTLPFHFHEEALQFLFVFCRKGVVICRSDSIDISPSILHSSLCFTWSGILHDVLCIKLNTQGDSIPPWHTSLPVLNQSFVPCPVLTVSSWPAYRFLRMQISWSDIPIPWRIFHSLLWSPQSKALA